jgi:hypothetical protein
MITASKRRCGIVQINQGAQRGFANSLSVCSQFPRTVDSLIAPSYLSCFLAALISLRFLIRREQLFIRGLTGHLRPGKANGSK